MPDLVLTEHQVARGGQPRPEVPCWYFGTRLTLSDPALTLLGLAAVPCPPRHAELEPGVSWLRWCWRGPRCEGGLCERASLQSYAGNLGIGFSIHDNLAKALTLAVELVAVVVDARSESVMAVFGVAPPIQSIARGLLVA
jgi:hypothetical protein